MTAFVCMYQCMPDTVSVKKVFWSLLLWNTHLAQQEELVCALLSVLIAGALCLLQVNSIQLEFLMGKTRTFTRFFFLCTHKHFSVVYVCERYKLMGTLRS